MRVWSVVPLVVAVSACGVLPRLGQAPESPAPVPAAPPAAMAPLPRPTARTPDALDTTTPAQRAEATAGSPVQGARLGTTIASLGNPTEPGFWIRTPLARNEGPGRIEDPATGKSVRLHLIPLDAPAGAGSQVSLPALRLLGVSLTALPEVVVYAE
jgi:hypothetical protein